VVGLAFAAMLPLGGASVSAQAPPNPPARFVGTVTVNGQPAAAGTTVQARIGTANCGTGAVFIENGQSRYRVDVVGTDASNPGCGADGATVSFFVAGQQAAQTAPWLNFQLNQLNLTVGQAATPSPTPTTAPGVTVTPTATPVPVRPPATGTGLEGGTAQTWPVLAALAGAVVAGSAGLALSFRRRK
jgi:hypothetical protein